MNSIFKKAAIVAMMSTATMCVFPAPSSAVVAAFTGGSALIATGSILTTTGAGLLVGGVALQSDILGWPGLTMGLLGVVILDGQNQVRPQFTIVSEKAGASIGMTADEMGAYNEQIDEINVIYQTIAQETQQAMDNGATSTEAAKLVSDRWTAYGQALSSDAQSGLRKVQAHLSI